MKSIYVALIDPASRSSALRLTMAALLAMTVSTALSLANPWWAAMAVWMAWQPTSGLLVEKGIAQLLGTMLGPLRRSSC